MHFLEGVAKNVQARFNVELEKFDTVFVYFFRILGFFSENIIH